ncbi:hypothetical protein [Streptomyces sp. NPDC005244]|uniref:hypothetical protein n=1 Tax=Streptomyces sp. NPDC005244 TaxID=3364708 RepID=UPI003699BE9E
MTAQEPDRLTRLAELATELLAETQALAEDSGDHFVSLAKRSQSNRRLIWLMIMGFALTAALTVGFGVALVRVDSNANRITELTTRLDIAQTATRRGAFCPLYQLLLQSKSAKAREAADDPEAYDHSFEVIEDGYKTLKCSEFIDGSPFTEDPKG